MREDYRMVEVEGDLRCASEILVWQHCILWMGLGNRQRCKDSGDRKLSQRLNYPGRSKILAWSTGRYIENKGSFKEILVVESVVFCSWCLWSAKDSGSHE